MVGQVDDSTFDIGALGVTSSGQADVEVVYTNVSVGVLR
jgi:hypothetical protein